jgi:beta-lactamase regulating signal transducer with metallopeptidase domain
MRKTELVYSLFMTAVVVGIVYCATQLFHKYTLLTLIKTVGDSCCQFFIKASQTGVQLAGMSMMYILVIAIGFLSFKAFFSLLKTSLVMRKLLQVKRDHLPTNVLNLCHKHNIPLHKITLITSKKPIVCTVGVFKPQIVISESILTKVTQSELEAILLHEHYHLQRVHPLLFMAGEVIGLSFNFLPLVHDVSTMFKLKLEKDADAWAAHVQGTTKYLRQALLKLGDQSLHTHQFYPSFSAQRTSERVGYLSGESFNFLQLSKINVLMTALILGFVIVLMKTPIYAQEVEQSTINGSLICENKQATTFACGVAPVQNQSRWSNQSSSNP